jgi:radical SAM superfamily enzyme YgiQ (UPF0313 family)
LTRDKQDIVIRPPSEAGSFLLQATYGCSHNRCTFFVIYKFVRFEPRPFRKIEEDIKLASRWNPGIKRVFLCDGNAMCLPTDELERILDSLGGHFPALERVGIYANAPDILTKTPDELALLRSKKLALGYLGLESGNDEILTKVKKGSTAQDMIKAVRKAQKSGIDMSIIVLLGLGSNSMSERHATDTALAVSRMNPSYLSALTLMLLPGTRLYREYREGGFELMNSLRVLRELRLLVANIEVDNCVFRTNHASNYLPIAGDLPADRDRILGAIDSGIANPEILRPDSHRAL